jgi:ATP-binding cassette subfamily B protein
VRETAPAFLAGRVSRPARTGLQFEDVGSRYEGSERWALRHVSLHLRPVERLAIVGENGAGKTTLTKLIARLFDPSEGQVLLDGVDLREYDLAGLRRSIGVILQDFVRYEMSFGENIAVGDIRSPQRYLEAAGHVPRSGKLPTERRGTRTTTSRSPCGRRHGSRSQS